MSFGQPRKIAEFGRQTIRRPDQPANVVAPAERTQTEIDLPVVAAALRYADLNWPVFPCKQGSKAPATLHGFKDATADPERIRELFDRSDYNIGIATGPSGLVVVDVDGEQGQRSLEALRAEGVIPETLTHRTRTGGQHLIFTAPPGVQIKNSQSKLGPGIDVRADGGYIVAPPSWVGADDKGPAGRYEVEVDVPAAALPDWLVKRLVEPESTQHGVVADRGARQDFPATTENIDRVRQALGARTPSDGWQREDKWFLTLLEVRSLRDIAGWPDQLSWALFDEWSRRVGGNYGKSKNRKRWDHADPPTSNPRTYRSLLASTQLEHRVDTSSADAGFPAGIDAASLFKKVFPPLVWVIADVLPEGCYLMSARPKVGKSWLALQMAVAVAHGSTMWGKSVTQGTVVGLFLEDNQRRLQSRLQTLRPNSWATPNLLLYTDWKRFNQGGLADLEALIQSKRPRLIIIDTLAKVRPLSGRNENAYLADYGALAPLTTLANKYRISIVIITHNRKGRSEDDPLEMISGTLGQAGAVDGAFVIEGKRGGESYTLTIAGRDIEQDGDFAISRGKDGAWQLLGSAAAVFASAERRAVVELLKLTGPLKPREIAERLGKKPNAVRQLLSRMLGEMQVDQHDGGLYGIP